MHIVFTYLNGDTKYDNFKLGLNFSDAEYSIYNGSAYLLVFAFFGILMVSPLPPPSLNLCAQGYLSDLIARSTLLKITTILYPIGFALVIFTSQFITALMTRVVFAALASATTPLAVSLLNNYFHEDQRGTAISIMGMAGYAGIILSSITISVNAAVG